MKNWDETRRLFPALQKFTYINAAEGSPISIKAANEAKQFYDDMTAEGDTLWEFWIKKMEEIRKKTADFINADPSEIAFTVNTSTGMNIIAQTLNNKKEVLTMYDEFPSSTIPWFQHGYKVHFVKPKNNIYSIESIEKMLVKKTKIVVSSYVQYKTGFKQDLNALGALCRKKGAVFVVNATQAAGAMPIDVKKSNVDFMVFSGLKWLMAGYSIAVLYINKKWLSKDLPFAGWRSVKEPDLMNNKEKKIRRVASTIECGCPPFPIIFALGGAIDFINNIGKEDVEKRIYELDDYLEKKIKELGLEIISPLEKKYRSGITIIKMKDASDLVKKLAEKNIIVSARGEGLRISMHVYNNENDIDRLIYELKIL